MKQRLYFAYGSNINLEQMARRCPDAVPVKPVVLNGYELAFRGWGGVATIIPKEGAKVHGLLWDLTPACEAALDRYEGYPSLYGKDAITVTDPRSNVGYQVMVYVMTPQNAEIAMEPSRSYFNGILRGYCQNGIHPQPLYEAFHATRATIDEQQAKGPQGSFRQSSFEWWQKRPSGKNNGNKPKNRGR